MFLYGGEQVRTSHLEGRCGNVVLVSFSAAFRVAEEGVGVETMAKQVADVARLEPKVFYLPTTSVPFGKSS
jgi:hypothetical protein